VTLELHLPPPRRTTIIDPPEATTIDPAALADIEKFELLLAQYQAGELDEDRWRVFRLANGIYGQRQGGTNQMVRVKIPYGSLRPEQLEMMATIARRYSRGWGHITTRQNIQFHYVALERIPDVMRDLASVGMTTREACGDTVRNVTGCHLAGACPLEVLDISPWAEAAFRHFLRHPYAQRLPRKFKINFSGCATDCGQAMFNDIGVVAVTRALPDGTTEAGFRVFVAGGLGATPHPAQALEDFTPREELMATLEAILRVFDHSGNRDNKLRARMKWLVDTLGIDELRARVLKERRLLIGAVGWPGGVPAVVEEEGDEPAGISPSGFEPGSARPGAVPVMLSSRGTPPDPRAGGSPYARWERANVVRGVARGTVSAYAHCPLGDVTAEQFDGLAALQRRFGVEVRVTNRQNVVFRGLDEAQLPELYAALQMLGLDRPGAELARDVVSCPGADTCNLAVTQSRGLASAIDTALDEAGLAEVGGVRVNISGCSNSCGQHHTADIGFFGVERRAHGQSAPGYQLLLGGHLGDAQVEYGRKALRLPAKACAEATVRLVGRYAAEREASETFTAWLDRSGGAPALAASLTDLAEFPPPFANPSFYVDYGETGPFSAEVGISECAG
jgi:sulfite reductase beta subunit-like hemoprotein